MPSYPPSTLAYPLLHQLLDSLLQFPVSSTSSTFTLPSIDTSSTLSPTSSPTTLPTAVSVTSLVSSTSAVPMPPISSLLNTTASTTPPVLFSSLPTPVSTTEPNIFLHPKDAVATSPNLQQYSAVRQLTNDLQLKKPRHPRRPQLPPDGIGKPVRRLVHTVVYKQKLAQYIDALKLYEKHLDELIQQTTFELDKNNNKLPLQNCVNLNRLSQKSSTYPLYVFKFPPIIALIIIIASMQYPPLFTCTSQIHDPFSFPCPPSFPSIISHSY